jgi:hypothetical protein
LQMYHLATLIQTSQTGRDETVFDILQPS